MTPKILYAVKSRDLDVLDNCSSGGFISILTRSFLIQGGIVYGVELGNDFAVHHVRIDSENDFLRIAGSKYVASDMRGVLQSINTDLEKGKSVLFIGTPCQCAAIQKLKKKISAGELCIVDLVCHGTVTQRYFNSYLEFLSDKFGKIENFKFRDKKGYGLSCISSIEINKNGKIVHKRLNSPKYNFYYYYMKADGFRESCYTCKYANLDRYGDFTVGDFWGIEHIDPKFDSLKGVSAVLINSSWGEELFSKVKPLIECKEENLQDYLPYNAALRNTVRKGKAYDLCQKMLKTGEGKQIFNKLYNLTFSEYVKGYLKGVLPSSLSKLLKRI